MPRRWRSYRRWRAIDMNRKILFTLVWTLAVIPCSTALVLSEKAGTQVAGEQEHKLQHGGDVEISGIEGSVNASSGSGNLVIKKVGPLTAHTGSGDVKVEDVTGQTNVSTGSGDISLSGVGSVEARAGSGDISVNGVKGSAKVQTGS